MSDDIDNGGKGGITRRDMMKVMAASGMMAAGAGGLLMTPGAAFAAPAPKRGGKIRVANEAGSTADTLDPAKASTGADYTRFFMFYSGLTQLDASLTPQMNLAESLQTTDAKTWIIKLRKGVTFHDGKPVGPADVVFSLMRHKNPATASKVKTLAEQFTDAKASGPDEVTLTLASANADLPVILATPQLVIVKDGTTDFSTGIGCGPYKLKSFAGRVDRRRAQRQLLQAGQAVSRRDRADRHQRQRRAPECAAVGRRAPDQRDRPALDAAGLVDAGLCAEGNQVGPLYRPDHAQRQPDRLESRFRRRDEVPVRSRAAPHGGVPRLLGDRQRPADSAGAPLLQRVAAAAAARSGQGEIPAAEGRCAGRHAAADLCDVRRERVDRNGRAAAAGRPEDRAEPAGQPRVARRLLVEPLDEAPAHLRQHQPAFERRRAVHAVLQVGCAVERVGLEEREVRPVVARRAFGNRRREAQADVRRHAGDRRAAGPGRHSGVHQLPRRLRQAARGPAARSPPGR